MNNNKYIPLDPPEHMEGLWVNWLQSQGCTGSIAELERSYLESKNTDDWHEYFNNLG